MNIVDRLGLILSSRSPSRKSVSLSQNNIYIFPSRIGFAFLLLLLIMLLTAINYQNSLVYLFTFLLGAMFFVSIWLCFLNLSGLTLSSVVSEGCFAGDSLSFEVSIRKESAPCYAVSLEQEDYQLYVPELTQGETERHSVLSAPKPRGVHLIDRLYIGSYYPFGFIRAWTWQKLESSVVVYPKPIDPLDSRVGGVVGGMDKHVHESEELSDLQDYQPGQPATRIVWKRYAARDQLVSRTREKASTSSNWVSWNDYDTSNTELKLSYMCFDILQLASKQEVYGLELPGFKLQPSKGERHKVACLEALAKYG